MLRICQIWPHGQAVKTSPSHGENRGSSPLGATNKKKEDCYVFLFLFCRRKKGGLERAGIVGLQVKFFVLADDKRNGLCVCRPGVIATTGCGANPLGATI